MLQAIDKDDYMFLFNSMLAYLQIKVNENFVKYLGLVIEKENGRRRYFQYLNLPSD